MKMKNTLTYLLTQIANSYRNTLQKSMNEIGLHSGQLFVLISLWETDGQSQIELAKNLKLSPPTIHKMIGSLQKNGFVESRRCESDGRAVRLFLTEKGIESETLVEERWVRLENSSFANLTETEKLVLSQLFGKMKENFIQNIYAFPNEL